ncbi:PRP38 family [Babesia microti strain RI]|uniref:Pre-mRNA-splicing factor 38 n=1 Tax=Babesia microti (strain RI) TaxID=1133968 RepID=A0A0K3ARQ5_BABMR|nr:PRP38 family [Babesia microti strain RI]CTQ41135.1 PRP38 family [Babesia microti strain RI]|eukprot:XP_012649146.1 PRP38 family [Babesia microti strain RI]
MANRTDPLAHCIHGTNPQFLVSKIIRDKIYNSTYWKESCFGLTAESLIDRAVELKYVGSTITGSRQVSPFICLVLKLLQIQPEIEIVLEYIRNNDYKYLRVLGAYYLRLVGNSPEIYLNLEPLLADYRKIRIQDSNAKITITHIDEFIDRCLRDNTVLDIDLPPLTRREVLEESKLLLGPRKSPLDAELGLNSLCD